MSRIFRYEVPVDDRAHMVELGGEPLAVGCRQADVVEFWALEPAHSRNRRFFIVVGTGHPIDGAFHYWGTAVAPGGQLVWHLLELTP
jgi:hypothetical protein